MELNLKNNNNNNTPSTNNNVLVDNEYCTTDEVDEENWNDSNSSSSCTSTLDDNIIEDDNIAIENFCDDENNNATTKSTNNNKATEIISYDTDENDTTTLGRKIIHALCSIPVSASSTSKEQSIISTDPMLLSQYSTILDRLRDPSKFLLNAKQFSKRALKDLFWKLCPSTQKIQAGSFLGITSLLYHEIKLQQRLTSLPNVYGQINNPNAPIYEIYQTMKQQMGNVINRPLKPTLGIGTHAAIASTMGYIAPGPPSNQENMYTQCREYITIPADGAVITLDWEIPPLLSSTSVDGTSSITDTESRKQIVLNGPIQQPVILLLHGINNDTSFGYIRSFRRVCVEHGWIGVAMNFRGCGGIPLATPRGYTGAYTGDIRGVIETLQPRIAANTPLILVGYSLGGNLVAKYLGEEGYSGTLPKCIAGGIALAQAMTFESGKLDPIWSTLLTAGIKKGLLQNIKAYKQMNTIQYKEAFPKMFWHTLTLQDFENVTCPLFISNGQEYPFQWTNAGYETPKDYANDAGSNRVIQFVSVPLLQIISKDDFLIYASHYRTIQNEITNPNIMVIETDAGGHLGWQEVNDNNNKKGGGGNNLWTKLFGSNWADEAAAQFIEALITQHNNKEKQVQQEKQITTTVVKEKQAPDFSSKFSKNGKSRQRDNATKMNIPPEIRSRL